jgi:hypothetical protein
MGWFYFVLVLDGFPTIHDTHVILAVFLEMLRNLTFPLFSRTIGCLFIFRKQRENHAIH